VTIPANSSARISIPKAGLSGPFTVTESGNVVWSNHTFQQVSGIMSADDSRSYITFDTGSGTYSFILKGLGQNP
jgi:hypothetical protein